MQFLYRAHHYKRIQGIMKTMFKLCSRRWLKSFYNIVINLAPVLNFIRWSCKLQNFIFEFAIASRVPKRWIIFSHSAMMVNGNKTSLKKPSLNYIKDAFLLHLLWKSSLQESVNRVKKLGACLLKHQSLPYSSICSICSISSFPLYN